MFFLFDFFSFFFLIIGPNTKFCLQEAQVYENQRKIEGVISIFIEQFYLRNPVLKENYERHSFEKYFRPI